MVMVKLSGQCLCGGVKFAVKTDDLSILDLCHCSQCRRWSGHAWAGLNAPIDAMTFIDDAPLKWYRSSPQARRGFCGDCGSSLFWQGDGLEQFKDRIGFSPAAIDGPTGLTLREHIFVADKGDYYDIADGLPQRQTI